MESHKDLNSIVNPLNHNVESSVKTAAFFRFFRVMGNTRLGVNRSSNEGCFAACFFSALP